MKTRIEMFRVFRFSFCFIYYGNDRFEIANNNMPFFTS